jgi:hypothetical protein
MLYNFFFGCVTDVEAKKLERLFEGRFFKQTLKLQSGGPRPFKATLIILS